MNLREKQTVIAVRFACGIIAYATMLAAQAQTTAEKKESPQRVEITGSNIKRVDKEGSSPIQTISAAEIQRSGATTVAELMRTLTVMGGGNANDFASGNSFGSGVSTVSLRGFGSSATLILLNGRRISAAAVADPNDGQSVLYDVNSIPAAMIERIEILKDGASAIYGSDAIAGVLNFITKSDYRGQNVGASYSANHQGKFGYKNFSGGYGYGDLDVQGYNVLLSIEAKQRERTQIRDANANIEQDIYYDMVKRHNPFNSSISNQAFFFKERSPGSKTFTTTGPTAQVPSSIVLNKANCAPDRLLVGSVAAHNLSASSYLVGRSFCNYDTLQHDEAQGASKDISLYSRASWKVTPTITAFGEFMLARNERAYTRAPSTISGTSPSSVLKIGSFVDSFQAILPIGHPDNPFKDARSAVAYRFENTNTDVKSQFGNLRLVAGLRGNQGKVDWESAVLWHRATLKQTRNGLLYFPTAKKLYTENRSIASLEADPTLFTSTTSNDMSEVQQIDAKASSELGQLSGGALGIAVGVEVRRENMQLVPDPVLARGDIVGLSNVVVDDSRVVSSAFMELRAPVLKNLEFDFAGRLDRYPGFKTSFVPKVGAIWKVTPELLLRSTYAQGFRAPSLSQLSTKGVQSFSSILDPLRCDENSSPRQPKPGAEQADCNKSYSKSSGGSANGLAPEKSKSITLGVIWSPTKSFDILVDFYKIRREDETATLAAATI